jgi:hypothetical protein
MENGTNAISSISTWQPLRIAIKREISLYNSIKYNLLKGLAKRMKNLRK